MFRTFIHLLSLSLIALTVASQLPGDATLCLGSDGHVAVEVATSHSQHEICASAARPEREPSADDCHEDCIDLAVCGSDAEISSIRVSHIADTLALPPAPLVPVDVFAVTVADRVLVPARGPPRAPAYLAERATIQLLI